MTREEKLAEIVYDAAWRFGESVLNAGEGEEFLLTSCGWTQEEIDEALEDCEGDQS